MGRKQISSGQLKSRGFGKRADRGGVMVSNPIASRPSAGGPSRFLGVGRALDESVRSHGSRDKTPRRAGPTLRDTRNYLILNCFIRSTTELGAPGHRFDSDWLNAEPSIDVSGQADQISNIVME
jgi:hypothetical protein